MNILSIETSCDETAAAIIKWSGDAASVIANVVSSQASLHAKWGGVVPDLASREHIKNIVPVIEETLEPFTQGGTPSREELAASLTAPGPGATAAPTVARPASPQAPPEGAPKPRPGSGARPSRRRLS